MWYAHAVHVDDDEIRLFAQRGTGVCHCPSSNMRLASGIAPIKKYLDHGVKVGIGADGSSSNDASNMLVLNTWDRLFELVALKTLELRLRCGNTLVPVQKRDSGYTHLRAMLL
nr:amidohydrolase family protein [Ktedonobacter sp. SOSP1-52]